MRAAQKSMKRIYNLDMHTKKYMVGDWSIGATMRENMSNSFGKTPE